jgi:hypothetical protein
LVSLVFINPSLTIDSFELLGFTFVIVGNIIYLLGCDKSLEESEAYSSMDAVK